MANIRKRGVAFYFLYVFKRYNLNRDLKVNGEDDLTSKGILFHNLGPQHEKEFFDRLIRAEGTK